MSRRGLRRISVKSMGMAASHEVRERVYSNGMMVKVARANHRSRAGTVLAAKANPRIKASMNTR
jgi:hypothetical protein